MIFDYRPSLVLAPDSEGGLTLNHRPMVILRIRGSRRRKCEALVDTGADECIFPASLARTAGIELSGGAQGRISGVGGGELDCTYVVVQLELTDGDETIRWSARVGFVEYLRAEHETLILGHAGFLEYFTATFDGEARTLELRPNRRLPSSG